MPRKSRAVVPVTTAQSLKWVVVTVMVFATASRKTSLGRSQKPWPSCVAMVRSASAWEVRSGWKVRVTGVANCVPSGPMR